ncbi:MAG: exodeoxyribonuclease III [Alphaproteobacteria bacterium]|nr:exodeoxyribonuclease III [Alphaproteobacteria bacterium]
MKIGTWNVNSIKAREEHVRRYLTDNAPDILMVQELKSLDFPLEKISSDYEVMAVGQKTYNGVAIFSKSPLKKIMDALPGGAQDDQARYLEVETNDIRLINIYLPNGNPCPGPKYDYKLAWMKRLYDRLSELRQDDIPFLIGGDFNVIPEEKDCYDPKVWQEDALFRLETRKAFRALLNLGLTDAFRVHDTRAGQYSFWDYQAGAWPKNNGIRIDHVLLSPRIADKLIAANINATPRGWDKPSDHTPVEIEIAAA